jgi:hypothetical protein
MVARKPNLVAKYWPASAWSVRVYARDSGRRVRVNVVLIRRLRVKHTQLITHITGLTKIKPYIASFAAA